MYAIIMIAVENCCFRLIKRARAIVQTIEMIERDTLAFIDYIQKKYSYRANVNMKHYIRIVVNIS